MKTSNIGSSPILSFPKINQKMNLDPEGKIFLEPIIEECFYFSFDAN